MGKNLVYVQSRSDRPTITGISDWVSDVSGKRMKKTKVGKTSDSIRPLFNGKVGGLANYISYTPWTEDGVQKVDDNGKPLMLQQKYEKKFNLPEGYLTNQIPIKGAKLKDYSPTYFMTTRWKLNDGTTVFDLSTLDGLMGYYVCLASKFVANSEKELRAHKWPYATHFISHQNESEEIKYSRNEKKGKAIAFLHSAEMTDSLKKKIVVVLNLVSSRSELTNIQAHNLLSDYIENSTYTVNSNIDKLLDIATKLQTPDGIEDFEAQYLLQKSIDYRVITEKQGTYSWIRPTGIIELGSTKSEALEFFKNPKKQALIQELEEEIRNKYL